MIVTLLKKFFLDTNHSMHDKHETVFIVDNFPIIFTIFKLELHISFICIKVSARLL